LSFCYHIQSSYEDDDMTKKIKNDIESFFKHIQHRKFLNNLCRVKETRKNSVGFVIGRNN
jgi:hypothetical protein